VAKQMKESGMVPWVVIYGEIFADRPVWAQASS